MKILIYGVGVIGSSYGWFLSNVGCDITVLVRESIVNTIRTNGIVLNCSDYRAKELKKEQVVLRPTVITELLPTNDFDYIIVPTNTIYLKDILPQLSQSGGNAHILFFQNIWDDFEEIQKWLTPGKYFFGFPFMIGGGKTENVIECTISGLKYSNTPLGELDGSQSIRLKKMYDVLNKAQLKPIISSDIKTWLITHYAVAAELSGGILKAGNAQRFATDKKILRETILAIRESLEVCKQRGIDIRKERSNRFYYLPLFISLPIARKIYRTPCLSNMFDGHINHSPEEIKKMIEDIIESADKLQIKIPNLKRLQSTL